MIKESSEMNSEIVNEQIQNLLNYVMIKRDLSRILTIQAF